MISVTMSRTNLRGKYNTSSTVVLVHGRQLQADTSGAHVTSEATAFLRPLSCTSGLGFNEVDKFRAINSVIEFRRRDTGRNYVKRQPSPVIVCANNTYSRTTVVLVLRITHET